MAAVVVCGPDAALSDTSAGALWESCRERSEDIHVSVMDGSARGRLGIVVHRRLSLHHDQITTHHGIPVTRPNRTLVDLAT